MGSLSYEHRSIYSPVTGSLYYVYQVPVSHKNPSIQCTRRGRRT